MVWSGEARGQTDCTEMWGAGRCLSGKEMFLNCTALMSTWWSHPLQICNLLGYYGAYSGNCLATFRYNLSDPTWSESLRYRLSGAWLKTSNALCTLYHKGLFIDFNILNMYLRHLQRTLTLHNLHIVYIMNSSSCPVIFVISVSPFKKKGGGLVTNNPNWAPLQTTN